MSTQTYQEQKNGVYRTTLILSVVTIVEVAVAVLAKEILPRPVMAIFMILATLGKAFFIVAIFMHLKFEVKNLILTVLIPVTLLFWAIVAFLWEGDWWLRAREAGLIDWMSAG